MPTSYTLPSNLLSTFDVGFFPADGAIHHEDLTDVLTIIDSFQTPFFSGAPKVRARDVVHSWPIDTLLSGTNITSGGAPDGVDFTGDALTTPIRLFNGTQIFRRDVIVSDRERQANPAGIRDMYEHQIMKEFKNIARNCEYAIFRNNSTASASAVEASAVSAAPLMAGIRGGFGTGVGIAITTASASAATGFTTGDMIGLALAVGIYRADECCGGR